MDAAILSIGDELALGQTVDTNSAWLAQQLAGHGVLCVAHATEADDQAKIADTLTTLAQRVDLLLVSGGLGPTDDDLTRQALADAMAVPLVEDEDSVSQIAAFFERRNKAMPDRNRIQALCPQGASMIANANGTAPGLDAKLHRARIVVMPGVPREMKAMFQQHVVPLVQGQTGRTIRTRIVHTFGLGESDAADALTGLMHRDGNPMVGTTVAQGIVSIRLRSDFPDATQAQDELDRVTQAVRDRLGAIVFGEDGSMLPEALLQTLRNKQLTVASAESCTGGLVGAMLTEASGSSEAVLGGWVTYSNAMKSSQLGVDPKLIRTYGAVSPQVAAAMARGAAERSGADLAVSTTGIAGPTGGTDEKPVGTVFLGLSGNLTGQRQESVYHLILPGNRPAVRDRTAKAALQALRLTAMGEPVTTMSWLRPVDVVGA